MELYSAKTRPEAQGRAFETGPVAERSWAGEAVISTEGRAFEGGQIAEGRAGETGKVTEGRTFETGPVAEGCVSEAGAAGLEDVGAAAGSPDVIPIAATAFAL